jgi:DNA polymerase family A
METVMLDYETFYHKKDYSIRGLGNWAYTHDPRFDAYMLSAYDGDEGWVGEPKDFNWEAVKGKLLLAHNASFDNSVTRRLVELGTAPAWLVDAPWQCTANLSSYTASVRSLADAVKVLEHRKLDKGMRDAMNGKTWAQAKQEGIDKKLAQYALDDSVEGYNLWKKYSPLWPQFERDLSSLTLKQCARGVAINVELLDQYRKILREVIFNLERNLPWTERGARPTSPIAIAEECRKAGIPAPPLKKDDEEGFDVWEITYGPQFPWVFAAGQWRSLGKLLSALDTIKERLRPDNTIDFSLLYFGAHTGRWSGGGSGLNLQNLRKVPLFIKNMCLVAPPGNLTGEAFKQWVKDNTDFQLDVRRIFIPRPGKKFILCDLSQIEPRVLAWLVGNTNLLNLLKGGMSIYEAFARGSMHWMGGVLKKEDADKYQLAKIQVLGLGYQCGWEKFIVIAAGYGVVLDEMRSRDLVTNFREENPRIVGLWDKLDNSFRRSINDSFELELPSGRSLTYRNVQREVRMKKNRTTGKFESKFVHTALVGMKRVELYGGKLAENLVQATARDIFGQHLLDLEANVGDVIWHVHDEAITEVDLDVTCADVEHTMSQCPEWIPGLPVGAEAKEAMFYTK